MAVKPVKMVKRIISPIEDFLQTETSSGIILMAMTIIAMVWANSPYYEAYEHFIELPLGFTFGAFVMEKSLHHWVNDGLMVIFFFVVGLEIKREMVIGELSTPRKAALPMFAALGGMLVPALIYTVFNKSGPGSPGWGIPMATDIAFAVGVLTLMGKRVPFALKIFLLALAIVDDLGAVLVIAFFYTDHIAAAALGTAAAAFVLTYVFKASGVRSLVIYTILGIIAWFAVLKSGIHATIAGVVLGLMTPLEAHLPKGSLPDLFKKLVDDFINDLNSPNEEESVDQQKASNRLSHEAEKKLYELKKHSTESLAPLDRLIHALHPWVSFVIMPVFALVNAGVRIEGISIENFMASSISLGILFGLFLGKPIGITLFSLLAVKTNLARLPRNVTWMHMVATGFLAGIGFTMALFISHLALGGTGVETYSKLGILVASVFAGLVGSGLLRLTKSES